MWAIIRQYLIHRPFRRRCQIYTEAAFTLLEVLVVLVLLSLVVTLLASGLSMTFTIRERFADKQSELRVNRLQAHWFREVCSAFTPQHELDAELFAGTPNRISGLSLSPLQSDPGVPTMVDLAIEQRGEDCVVFYQQAGVEQIEIAFWPSAECRFRFVDKLTNKKQQWPPASFSESEQLPRAIILEIEQSAGLQVWITAISGRTQPRSWVTDEMF